MTVSAQTGARSVNDFNSRQSSNRKRDNKKLNRECSNYGGSGHLKENCFKLISYLEWYIENRDQKISSQGGRNYAIMSVNGDNNVNSGENTGRTSDNT